MILAARERTGFRPVLTLLKERQADLVGGEGGVIARPSTNLALRSTISLRPGATPENSYFNAQASSDIEQVDLNLNMQRRSLCMHLQSLMASFGGGKTHGLTSSVETRSGAVGRLSAISANAGPARLVLD